MAREAWGRWGAGDEAGALNLVGAPEVLAAAGLVRQGVVVSLAQPLSPRMPVPGHRPALSHFMGRDGGDYAAGARATGGFQFAEDTVVLPLHCGTHVDALCHVWYGDELYNGFSGNTVRSVSRAERCGIDKMPPVVARGLLLDCIGEGESLADGTVVGVERLRALLARRATEIRKGDVVLLRTGWQERALRPGAAVDYEAEPGLDVEAAEWLARQDVAMIGADNFAVEVLPFPQGTIFPVHQRLIRDYGIPLLEGLLLRELSRSGVAEFLFVLAPLPIKGGTGSPVTPLAVF